MSELAGLLVGFVLTLFIYSYLFGDNPLYRFAIHLLVGVSAGYAAVLAVQQVLLPAWQQISQSPASASALLWLIPVLLGLLLLLKLFSATAWLGNSAVAAMLGIGAAVALVGAISGTLWPQALAGAAGGGIIGLLTALLTVSTLLYFQFTGRTDLSGRLRWPAVQRLIGALGRTVITITFGALFASLLSASLALLAERISFYGGELVRLLAGG